MPTLAIGVDDLLANLTADNAAALGGGALDGGQVWYQFLTQQDDRVRPSHRALHGTVWTAGDPSAPMPPLDFGCRCYISYVAAPGSPASRILPTAPSSPTTQADAFGAFLDAEAAGWRTAWKAAQDRPAGDAVPSMTDWLMTKHGFSLPQARDAASMAAATTQAAKAISGPIPPTPSKPPTAPGSSAVAPVPAIPAPSPALPDPAIAAAKAQAAADAAKLAKAQAAKAAAAAAEDAAAEAQAQAIAAAKAAKAKADAQALDDMLAAANAKMQALMAAANAKATANAGPKFPKTPEQKAKANAQAKARREAKKARAIANLDAPNAVGTVAPVTDAQKQIVGIASPSMMPAKTPPPSLIGHKWQPTGVPFGDPDSVAAARGKATLDEIRNAIPKTNIRGLQTHYERRESDALINEQISRKIGDTDSTTQNASLRFSHQWDRYMRMADRGASLAEIKADLIGGIEKGVGPLKSYGFKNTAERDAEAEGAAMRAIDLAKDMNAALAQEAYVRRTEVLYRGMHSLSESQLRGIINAPEFTFGAMSSTSTNAGTAEGFARQGGGNKIVVRMVNAKGIPIKAMSNYSSENEVIVSKQERFRVVGVYANAEEPHMFYLDMEAIE
jgi:hypothetical protein